MSEKLPQGWEIAELGALGRWRGGGTPSKSVPAYWSNGAVHWVSPKDMKRLMIDSAEDQITLAAVKESAANLIPKDSVLMVTRSGILEHTFPVAINTVEVVVNQDLKAWTPHPGINPLYAAYFLKAEGRSILKDCAKDGTTVSSIDFDRLKAYPVRLAPEAEQARIVSKVEELLSSIDEGERALERVQKLVERYRQSVLKAAVTGELTKEWREQHAGELESGEALLIRILEARRRAWETAELAKMTAKGQRPANDLWKRKYEEPIRGGVTEDIQLPDGWIWVSLSQLAWSSNYGTSEKCGYQEGGLPVLRIPNVRLGRLDLADIKRSIADLSVSADDLLKTGDLLTIRTNGSPSILGNGTVIRGELPFACYFASYAIRFRLVLKEELAEWINFCWQTSLVRAFIDRNKATSAGQYNISQSSLFELQLPIPPVYERKVIVDRIAEALSKANSVLLALDSEARRSTALKQSVLRSAFLGALVPQDEADEPASVLLDRITAERAAAPAEMSVAKDGKGKRRFPSGMTKGKMATREAAPRKGKTKA